MKAGTVSLLVILLLLFTGARPLFADDLDYTPAAVGADALVVRPLCFIVTVLGTGLFIATLPIAVISRSTGKSAHALVGVPAHQTFGRKLGDLSGMDRDKF
ncbi:MAG TPA: hypothetical protein VHY22_09450 [Chthoniobacteraceae bacterium]|nr:hypothetical protein [Chthoniobacteraceae bacterium]